MTTSQATAIYRRTTFTGRTDKFAPPQLTPSGLLSASLEQSLKSISAEDVSGSVLSDPYVRDATARLSGYETFINYFAGRHHDIQYEGGDKKVTFNFPRKIVNKRASWAAGRDGFRFLPSRGNEEVAYALQNVWRSNNQKTLIRRTAKYALITGDAYWYVTVKTKDRTGNELPREKWTIKITTINPSFVFPIWAEDDPSEMRAVLIQFPIWDSERSKQTIFSAYYTHDKVRFYTDYVLTYEAENVLGLIPVIHIGVDQVGDLPYGTSPLSDIIPIQDQFNKTVLQIARIIKYHSDPTTLVFGTSLGSFERAANRVWSNLPADARVENLEMKSDLAAAYKFYEGLKDELYEQGRTPQISFDSRGLAVSNTSGVALQLLFQPLVEATNEIQDDFTLAIRRVNVLIDAIYDRIFGIQLSSLADVQVSHLDMDLKWASLLPKDEQLEMDLIAKQLELGLISRAEASRRLSGVSDTERLALEIASDRMQELAMDSQKAVALQGNCPNLSSAFLGSIFLSENLVDIASKIGDLEPDNGPNGSSDVGSQGSI